MFTILMMKIKGYKNELPLIVGFIAMMLIFTYIFGASFTSNYRPMVSIVDKDNSEYSQIFLQELSESNRIKTKITNYDDAVKDVESEKAIAAIVFEEGFGENLLSKDASIKLIKNKEVAEIVVIKTLLEKIGYRLKNDIVLSKVIIDYLEETGLQIDEVALKSSIMKETKESWEKRTTYKVEGQLIDSDNDNGYDNLKHALIGFAVFFSLFFVFFGIGSIVDEKQNNVWQRQLVSPISKSSIIAGNMVAAFILGLIEIFLMVYLGKFLFGVDWGNNDFGVIIVLSAFIFSTTCLGLLISTFVKTQQQLSSIIPVITVSTSMLGGCMWPLDFIQSKVLIFLASLTPQKWAIEGIEKMVMYGYDINVIVLPVSVLILMGIVYFVISVLLTKETA